jgi:hypothetical protein
MPLVKYFIFLILAISGANAEEHGAPAAEHGAPAGGEHGSGAATEKADYSGQQSQAWSEVQTKLAAAKAKVDTQDALVKALSSEKEHLSGAALSEKIEQLKKEHIKWQKLVSDYNTLNNDYETKFPEKGIKEVRKYKRIDPKNIERIENDKSLDGRILRLQNKILKQYPKTAQKIEAEKELKLKIDEAKKVKINQSRKSDPHQKNKKKSVNDSDVTGQIILNK